MKPKTILQKRVYEIHKNLPALTQHQKEWALEHCFKHLCIYHKTTKEYICVDCGHRWKYDDLSGNCPHCNSVLTFHDKPRQRVFKDWKNLCKASHNCFYDKHCIMQSNTITSFANPLIV